MKYLKKLAKLIFAQKTTIILLLIAQIALLIFTFFKLSEEYTYINIISNILAFAITIFILNKKENPAYKIAWILPLLAIPLFGTAAYFIFVNQHGTRKLKAAYHKKMINTKPYLTQKADVLKDLKRQNEHIYHLAQYTNKFGSSPIYHNSSVEYFKVGEDVFEVMKAEIKKAEHFIFVEYFIIDQGEMWGEIEKILLEKSAQGVEVRLLYDGMGSQSLLPYRYDKKMREKGIKCRVFNPFRPMLSAIQNNRDHRKIMVIDGHTALTGGINLADEYINKKERFGYWKDSSVMVKGEAVWNFTMMFLQMWEITDIGVKPADYDLYRPERYTDEHIISDGYVMPYGESPLTEENIGEMVYLNIINTARKYIYIMTPYLVLDNEIITALGYAAKSGVDVRVIVPGNPDKWYVKSIGWSYYKDLIEMGIKIYEYDGFIHSKSFVSDDDTAVVGTINLDFRSLYLHFECAAYMYQMPCIFDVKADFKKTVKNDCVPITLETCENRAWFKKLTSAILRIIGPLL